MSDANKRPGEKPEAQGFNLRDVLARIPDSDMNPVALRSNAPAPAIGGSAAAGNDPSAHIPPPIPAHKPGMSAGEIGRAIRPQQPVPNRETLSVNLASASRPAVVQQGSSNLRFASKPYLATAGIGAACIVIAASAAIYRTGAPSPVPVQASSAPETAGRSQFVGTLVVPVQVATRAGQTNATAIQPASANAEALAHKFSQTPEENAPAPPRPAIATETEIDNPAGKNDDEDRARSLFVQGEARLAEGDVMGARMFFKKGAEAGDAQSAIAMGATYDPTLFAALKVQGMRPDIELARQWYQKAVNLGSKDARDRLDKLAAK